jgi:hypothetical protein
MADRNGTGNVRAMRTGSESWRAVGFWFCGVLLLLAATSAPAQETLTNADVVKMVQAHLSVDVIVEQIQTNPGNYVLTTASLIRLKQLGVPDKVIAAMQAKKAAGNTQPAPPPQQPSAPPSYPGGYGTPQQAPAAPAPPQAPPQQDQGLPADNRLILVTRAQPTAEWNAVITAPGMNNHISNQLTIDARDFAQGGLLEIDIAIPPDSPTAGSFDLFDGPGMPPDGGFPSHHLKGKYDVPPGQTAKIQQKFSTGQEFAINLEGNWFSPQGATSPVIVKVSVR